MNRDFNPEDFVYFVLESGFINRASNSFVLDYFDSNIGDQFTLTERKSGQEMVKRFKFDRAHRNIRIPKRNETLLDAIRNHPLCAGSRNGTYIKDDKGEKKQVNVLFKELNNDKDAEVMITASELKAKALNKAVEISKSPEEAEYICLSLGLKAEGKQSHAHLLLFAEKEPTKFLEVVDSKDTKARGLVKKGINKGIFERKGVMYFVDDVEFGVDFEDVISTIIKDEDKRTLLFKKINE